MSMYGDPQVRVKGRKEGGRREEGRGKAAGR